MLFCRSDDVVDRLLNTHVDDVVAVVGQDDIDQVLADVVDIASNCCKDNSSLAALIGLFHVRLQERDSALHYLGRLQHEGKLHLAFAEALSNYLHALEQVVVDDI